MVLPAGHSWWPMNKTRCLTMALDSTVEDEKIKFLVEMSYELTK